MSTETHQLYTTCSAWLLTLTVATLQVGRVDPTRASRLLVDAFRVENDGRARGFITMRAGVTKPGLSNARYLELLRRAVENKLSHCWEPMPVPDHLQNSVQGCSGNLGNLVLLVRKAQHCKLAIINGHICFHGSPVHNAAHIVHDAMLFPGGSRLPNSIPLHPEAEEHARTVQEENGHGHGIGVYAQTVLAEAMPYAHEQPVDGMKYMCRVVFLLDFHGFSLANKHCSDATASATS